MALGWLLNLDFAAGGAAVPAPASEREGHPYHPYHPFHGGRMIWSFLLPLL